jgi:hypothetical protein
VKYYVSAEGHHASGKPSCQNWHNHTL